MSSKQVRPIPFTEVTDHQKAKFWQKVDQRGTEECWPWTGAIGGKPNSPRGQMRMNKAHLASCRVGWLVVHGADPFPLHILHRCDNGLCHNPRHWFLGTNHENCIDKNLKDRGGRKLDNATVSQIKKCLREETRQNMQELFDRIALRHGVTRGMIAHLYYGRAWRHIA